MKKIISYGIFVLLIMMAGCDIVEKDANVGDVKRIQMYAASNRSAVIDLQKVFTGFNGAIVPSGNSKVTYFGDRYLKYKSAAADGDRFSFDVKDGSKSVRVNVDMLTQGDDPECDASEAFTYASISNRDVLVVNLLNNPEFCGYNNHSLGEIGIGFSRPGIDVNQNSAGVNIAICGCLEEGNTAILTYVPPTGFVGQVKFKYYLHAVNSGNILDEYGEVVYYDPQYSDYFTAHEVIIDVTDGSL